MMIFMDPPEHTHLRKLVSRAFTPRAIDGLEDRVRRLCAGYLDRFVGDGGFDYIDEFAGLVPPTVILALMGFPEGHADEWRQGIDEMFHMEEGEQGFTGGRRREPRPARRHRQMRRRAVPDAAGDARSATTRTAGRPHLGAREQRPRRAGRQHPQAHRTRRSVSFMTLLSIAGTETVRALAVVGGGAAGPQPRPAPGPRRRPGRRSRTGSRRCCATRRRRR